VVLVVLILFVAYMLIPSYVVAIGMGLPFPYVLFPPIGHNLLYGREYNGYSDYTCTEMSQDAERWLESMGLHTYGVSGWKNSNITLTINQTTGEIDYDLEGGNGHRWLRIRLGWLTDLTGWMLPFDAQNMLPVDPDWLSHYQVVTQDEGKYVGGQEIRYTEDTLHKIRVE